MRSISPARRVVSAYRRGHRSRAERARGFPRTARGWWTFWLARCVRWRGCAGLQRPNHPSVCRVFPGLNNRRRRDDCSHHSHLAYRVVQPLIRRNHFYGNQDRESVTDKIAVTITGGSRGLGRNTAIDLARRGVDVIFTYRSNQTEAGSLIREIEAIGQKAAAFHLDTRDVGSFDGFVAEVGKAFGGLGAGAV